MRALVIAIVVVGCGGPKQTEPKLVPVSQAPPFNEPDPKPTDDKVNAAAAGAFIRIVQDSRPELSQCFMLAAKRQQLTNKIDLSLIATFDAHGKSLRVHMMPPIDRPFEQCVQSIGSTWKLDIQQEMTFKATVELALTQ